MRPKRWLILASHVPPAGGLGGMTRYTVEVAKSLVVRDDVEVHVHCTPDAAPFFVETVGVDPGCVAATATGSTIRDSLLEVFGLGKIVTQRGIDVVLGSKQLLPRRSHGALRVLAAHDMLPLYRPEDFGVLKRHLLPPAYRLSIRNADLLVNCSEAARQQVARYEPEAAERAHVVLLAMTDVLRTVDPQPVAELIERPFALCVGDQSPRKNASFLLGIWPEVVARVPDAHLALIGPPGWGRNENLSGLGELISAGAVSHLGRVDDGALRWAYEHARVTLCPSLLEGYGLPVVEAMLLGSPTVISTDPAQVEVAEGTATVLPVTDGDRWVDAIVDHFESPRCAVPRLDNRTWDDVVDDLVGLVDRTNLLSVG